MGAPAFALPEAGYTDPIRTAFGHHVVWVKDIHPAATAPLDEVLEEIRLAVALELAVDELIERANTLEDAMLAGDGLESAAAAAGLEVERFEGIDRTGRNAAGARPEGLPQAARREAPTPLTPALVESLFATPEGEVVLQNGFDRVFVAVLQDRLPPEETEAGVREQVAAVIDRDRRLEVVRAFQRAVRARYSVEIDRAGIDRVLR